jgi:hypothetical protein
MAHLVGPLLPKLPKRLPEHAKRVIAWTTLHIGRADGTWRRAVDPKIIQDIDTYRADTQALCKMAK